MRLRNVKGASKRIEQSPYIINNYKDYKGNFSSLFLNNNPINIEIGMGKGLFIISLLIWLRIILILIILELKSLIV